MTRYLRHCGYTIGVLNPLITNRLRETQLRQTKTDKIDARVTTQALMLNLHQTFSENTYDELKKASRMRIAWIHERSKLKVDIVNFLDTLFPEYAEYFKNAIHSKLSYHILLKYTSAQEIASARIDGLSNRFITSHKNRNPFDLKALAKSSIGSHSDILVFQLKATIERIIFINTQIKKLEAYIAAQLQLIDSPILTIPGISNILAATILGEIGDISKFSTPSKIIAFAGLNPRKYQSGQYDSGSLPLSKRGSRSLRYALFQAAQMIWRFDPTFNNYYQRKKNAGKHHFVVIGHITHKLVNVIFHLLTTNSSFVKGY
ncbi:IS110 family transposase [Culicoidibacter larvae]|uniref:IS110 family transposase n=1 Tax=Culicoidibacter larvae TaxID=2579976 RepID=A0A5R8QEL8_9FIRM|nr:IS110 family transposase [Culicoidibacter larvae]